MANASSWRIQEENHQQEKVLNAYGLKIGRLVGARSCQILGSCLWRWWRMAAQQHQGLNVSQLRSINLFQLLSAAKIMKDFLQIKTCWEHNKKSVILVKPVGGFSQFLTGKGSLSNPTNCVAFYQIAPQQNYHSCLCHALYTSNVWIKTVCSCFCSSCPKLILLTWTTLFMRVYKSMLMFAGEDSLVIALQRGLVEVVIPDLLCLSIPKR